MTVTEAQLAKAQAEFAAALNEADESFRRYVVEQINLARLRIRLHLNHIEQISVALKGGMIAPDTALEWLTGTGMLDYVEPPAPVCCSGDDTLEGS